MPRSKTYDFDGGDPSMLAAYKNARSTFRYFWREVAWERRRIIPALDLFSVKAPFSDGDDDDRDPDDETPRVEHMWLREVDFDGQFVRGELLNSPNWLQSIAEGDPVEIPLDEISDWMYACAGQVYGAYTVNLLRSRMSPRERKEHDDAWGLEFGDPARIRLAPTAEQKGGFLSGWFGKQASAPPEEHPMCAAMAEELPAQLAEDPSLLTVTDDAGMTLLHQEALAGNLATVQILLEAGADPQAVTNLGMTPLQLAQALGWDKVAAVLL